MYKLEFKKSVKKDLKNIDKARVKKILREIDGLKIGQIKIVLYQPGLQGIKIHT